MTLEELQVRRAAYIAAELSILRSQEYTLGSGPTARKLVRADLAEVRKAITDLDIQIQAAQPAPQRARRITYVRPF
ncbi:hypothetical protein BH10PSE18_BH10PSE18_15170 [soil metagenome]